MKSLTPPSTSRMPGQSGGRSGVTADDTTSGYLEDKIVAGDNITITKQNAGANESLSIATDAVGFREWTYFSESNPSGVAVNPTVMFQFDGTANQLTDRMGSGNVFTLITGATFNCYPAGVLVGLGFIDNERYKCAVDADLQIRGAITIETLFISGADSGSSDTIVTISPLNNSDAEADNVLYGLYLAASTRRPWFYSEHGAGIDDINNFDAHISTGVITQLTAVRDEAGNVTLYENGQSRGTAALTLPTGGTNSRLTLGAEVVGAHRFTGVLFGLRITAVEFTAAQVLASYTQVRGG